jgi:hypothetical protein
MAHVVRAGFALVVAGIVAASVGLSSRAWWSLILVGFAVLVVAAVARAGAPRPRR